ncbi:hypothetical protein E8E12_001185 [Didymella heteroderae]|uniref:Uncharacterized protein n=1 Tax=Didymella heteroderae TaxID=1769908 RepID=A0A9P4WQL7_9PLEO|nr:hypothetical protein E8E12_001185 [Didymella heteroderae]
MSFQTKPAFVHFGTWDDETRAHPAMKWMEQYTYSFDGKAIDEVKNNAMSHDHVLIRTTGQKDSGAQASVDALYKEIYAPFAKWSHVPEHLICYEVDDGWEMMGFATLWWNLAVPGKQESGGKVKDAQGNEWDGANPAAFNFRYRRDGDSIRMCKTEVAADPSAAMVGMLKRGMMKPEDLMK